MPYNIVLWIHLIAMIGALGGLMHIQFGLPVHLRDRREDIAGSLKLSNLLLAVGFVVGFVLYYMKIRAGAASGNPLPAATHMAVGIKFLLFLSAMALLGIGAKKLRDNNAAIAHTLRLTAIVVLALAALLGVCL